jgi:hypothetical protein
MRRVKVGIVVAVAVAVAVTLVGAALHQRGAARKQRDAENAQRLADIEATARAEMAELTTPHNVFLMEQEARDSGKTYGAVLNGHRIAILKAETARLEAAIADFRSQLTPEERAESDAEAAADAAALEARKRMMSKDEGFGAPEAK